MARQCEAPTADSSMPPTQQGTPASAHRRLISRALVSPPTRTGLMFTHPQAFSSMALRALSTPVMLSSRQTGVLIAAASLA